MSTTFANNYLDFFKGNSWGSHICHFYNNQEELIEVLVPYFIDGLKNNEACIWVVSEPLKSDEAKQLIARDYPSLEEAIENGQFEFLSYKDVYLDQNADVKPTTEVLHNWLTKEDNALNRGFNGLRITGTVNFLKSREQWKDFVNYECFVCENLFPHKIKGICSYPLNEDKDLLHVADVVLNHQAILAKREGKLVFSENPQNKITRQLREQEEKLVKMAKELSSSNEELARFASVASHDLKEPIRMVSCFTGLLEKKYKDQLDEDGLKYLNFSNTGAKRAYNLINNLLEYTHLDRNQLELKSVNCNTILESVIENLRLNIEESNAKISCDLLPEVEGSDVLLGQLFQNLISNAIKFKNGSSPEIKISSQINEDHILLSFKDNGIGITNEFLPEVFTAFKKYHNKSEFAGDGIGLAICKKIVDKHNGEIWVESQENEGSEFFIKLPVRKEVIQKIKWQNILNHPVYTDHIVQIYNDKNFLAETVSYFISHGLNNDEAVLIVAREENQELFLEALKRKYIDTENMVMAGQLIFLSAKAAKSAIMVDNKPSKEYFERSIGKMVAGILKKYKHLRIYGEIVDLLAEEGNMSAASELENFWNQLLQRHNFSLLCAYDQKNVKDSPDLDYQVSSLCAHHNHVIPRSINAA